MESDTKNLKDLLRKLVPGEETVFDVATEIGEDGEERKSVSIGYRPLLPELLRPERADAKARSHVFHSLDPFIEYLNRESAEDASVVLADVDKREIVCVLDESDTRDRETVTFLAKIHPLFAPWLELIGKAIPVLEFALHVMKYRNAVTEPNGRELALLFSQIKASKRVTKHVGIGPKAINGVVVEMQIGTEKHETSVDLPESIYIAVPLFLSTDPMEVQLDLLVTEGCNEALVVFVTAPDLEAAMIRAFEAMVLRIQTDTGRCVGLGQVKHREFETLKFNR